MTKTILATLFSVAIAGCCPRGATVKRLAMGGWKQGLINTCASLDSSGQVIAVWDVRNDGICYAEDAPK